jgi:glycosyltransferase involved in cell wall biosynthesis
VIPTRDRPEPLARCLAALRGQQGIELEVVVVDDGSSDPGAVERAAAALPGAHLVRLEGAGPAAARNAGVREATGEIVLLTDDDCVPSAGWAATLARAAREHDALAAGRTVFDERRPLVVASEMIVAHAERRAGFAATRNVALPLAVARANRFDERFAEAGGEDREWCRRLRRRGTPLVRVERAVLRHEPELDLAGFWRLFARYGRAAGLDDGVSPGRPRDYGALVASGFRRGPRVGVLVLLAQAATLVGYAGRRSL